jgi:dienelactone hydrolase
MQWTDGATDEQGVRERPFRVGDVPGLLWTPTGTRPRSLVLIGHGGASHKRSAYVVSLARRLVRHRGMAAVAIDGPNHGERHVGERDGKWLTAGIADQVVLEWQTVVDAVQALDQVGDTPVGYWGLSMGARFGVPLMAREPRIRAGVVGLSGPRKPEAPIAKAAAGVSCPVLVLLQWDDELVERAAVLALFDALGSTDKRMYVHVGRHQAVPPEAFDASEAFLSARLNGAAD